MAEPHRMNAGEKMLEHIFSASDPNEFAQRMELLLYLPNAVVLQEKRISGILAEIPPVDADDLVMKADDLMMRHPGEAPSEVRKMLVFGLASMCAKKRKNAVGASHAVASDGSYTVVAHVEDIRL